VLTRRALAWAAAGAALGTHALARAGTPADTLVLAQAIDDLVSLDPQQAFEPTAGEIVGNCYERLLAIDIDEPSRLRPEVASHWSLAADGRTWRFDRQAGQRFASGHALTADDVAFSLQRAVLLDQPPAFILGQFGLTPANVRDKVRAPGPLTLTLETDQAYVPDLVLKCLTANVASVVDRALLLTKEVSGDLGLAWLRNHHAGSGALSVREWRANEGVVLDRNPLHRSGGSRLAHVIYRHVKEAGVQRLLLEKGDIDIARNLTPVEIEALSAHPSIGLASAPKGTLFYIALNQKHPILSRPEVREAFKWLVDYDAIGATLLRHVGVVHQNFLPPGLPGASTERPFRLDVERARRLLAQAGVPDGFKVSIDMRSVQPLQGLTEAVQQTFRLAGIELLILPGDGRQVMSRYRARRHELYIGTRGVDYWDPHSNADTFTRNPDNGDDARVRPTAWRNAWDIPELTRQSDAAARERDPLRRRRLYEALQAEFRRGSPFVMLAQWVEVAAFRQGVRGLRIGPTTDTTCLWRVSKG
jgi:peptide/nickel transport system substrate-binding protein